MTAIESKFRTRGDSTKPLCGTMIIMCLCVTSRTTHGFVVPQFHALEHTSVTTTTTTTTTALQDKKDWSEYMEISDGAVSNKGAPDPFERMRQRPPRTSNPNARAVNFGPDFDGGSSYGSSGSYMSSGSGDYREESDVAYRSAVTKSNNVPSDDVNNIPSSFQAEEQDSSKWASFMTVSDGPDPVPDPVQRQYQQELEKQREVERQEFEESWKQQFPNQPVPPPPPDFNKRNEQNKQQSIQVGPFPNQQQYAQQQQQQYGPPMDMPPQQQYPNQYMDPYSQQQQQQYPQQNNYWPQDPSSPYAQQQQQQQPYAQPPGPYAANPYAQQQQQPQSPYAPPPQQQQPGGSPYSPQSQGPYLDDRSRTQSVVQQRMAAEMAKYEQEKLAANAASANSPNGLWSPGTESNEPPSSQQTEEASGWSAYMSVSDGPEPLEFYAPKQPQQQPQQQAPPFGQQQQQQQAPWGQQEQQQPGSNMYGNSNNSGEDPWLTEQQRWQQQQLMEQARLQRQLDEERRVAHMSVDNSPQVWEQQQAKARARQEQAERVAQLKAERLRQEETLRELEKARAIARYRVLRTRLELERRVQVEEEARARAMAKIQADEVARRAVSSNDVRELARREAEEKAIREADKKIRQERERLQAEELSKAESAAREWEAAVARARAKILAEEIMKRERSKKEDGDGDDLEKDASEVPPLPEYSATSEKKAFDKRKLDKKTQIEKTTESDWKAMASEAINRLGDLDEEDRYIAEQADKIQETGTKMENRSNTPKDDEDEDTLEASRDEERRHRALLEAHLANEDSEKDTNSVSKKNNQNKPAPTTKRNTQPIVAEAATKRNRGSQSVVKFFDAPLVATNARKKSTSPIKEDKRPLTPEAKSVSSTGTQKPSIDATKADANQPPARTQYFANRIIESRKRALLASIQAATSSETASRLVPDVAERINDLIQSVEQEALKASYGAKLPASDRKQHFASRIEESRKRASMTGKTPTSAPTTMDDPPAPPNPKEQGTKTAPSVTKAGIETSEQAAIKKGRVAEGKDGAAVGISESRRRSLLASIQAAKKSKSTFLTDIQPDKMSNSTVVSEQAEKQLPANATRALEEVKSDLISNKTAELSAAKDNLNSTHTSSFDNLKMISGPGKSKPKTFLQAVGNKKNGKSKIKSDQASKINNGKPDVSDKATGREERKGVTESRKERTPEKK